MCCLPLGSPMGLARHFLFSSAGCDFQCSPWRRIGSATSVKDLEHQPPPLVTEPFSWIKGGSRLLGRPIRDEYWS